jgi:hypothetical protein
MVEFYEWTRTPARIGPVRFARFGDPAKQPFSHPTVNVDTEAATVTHQTLNDRAVVQTFGSKPDQISIEGVAPERDVTQIDNLVETGAVTLRSERFQGKVIVESTSTDYRRERTNEGEWLVDFTISAVEVSEDARGDLLPAVSAPAIDSVVEDVKQDIEETANDPVGTTEDVASDVLGSDDEEEDSFFNDAELDSITEKFEELDEE